MDTIYHTIIDIWHYTKNIQSKIFQNLVVLMFKGVLMRHLLLNFRTKTTLFSWFHTI